MGIQVGHHHLCRVSYAPFNGQTQAQSEVGEPDRGEVLEGEMGLWSVAAYRYTRIGRVQVGHITTSTAAAAAEAFHSDSGSNGRLRGVLTVLRGNQGCSQGGNTPRSEASCSSYYANLLDAVSWTDGLAG